MNFPIPEYITRRLKTDAKFAESARKHKEKYDASMYAEKFPRTFEEIANQLFIEERSDAITVRMNREAEKRKAFEIYLEKEKKLEKALLKYRKELKLEAVVEKMPTLKCPRCYVYDGIDDNFMKICDRCCTQLLDGADTLVEMGRLSLEERETMVSGIKSAQLAQLEKYRR